MKVDQVTLPLATGRQIVRRAVEKAEELGRAGAFVLVDAGGIVVTASRMDTTSSHSYPISRAKAYSAATLKVPSQFFHDLVGNTFPGIFTAFQKIMRDDAFPGHGAQHVTDNGLVIGAISTGVGVPPFVRFPGVEPAKLLVEGKPANAEDLCISYALGKGYSPQHGDDLKRWIDAYGEAPSERGVGLAVSPKATRQRELDAALEIADRAIAEAVRRGVSVCVAITDRHGDIIQIDRMDNAPPMSPDAAEALAVTALNFRDSSATAADYPDLRALEGTTTFKFLPVAGGLPIKQGASVIGAIGIHGAAPEECEEIARIAITS